MPATEQTWRNQARLDVIFAITGVLMLLATLLMFYRDHERPWKKIQPVAVNLEQKMTDWRKSQYQTHDAIAKHDKLQQELLVIQSTPIAPELMEKFIAYAGGAGPATLSSSDDSVGKPMPKPAEDMANRSRPSRKKLPKPLMLVRPRLRIWPPSSSGPPPCVSSSLATSTTSLSRRR